MANEEHIRTIRRARDLNKLVVFVGSAVSFDSGLPSWGDLIEDMEGALDVSSKGSGFLKIAELYYLLHGRNAYFNKVEEYFPNTTIPNYLHELILKLAPQHIVTTNWDDLLEKAIAAGSGELYFPAATDHLLAASSGSRFLVKMHGDFQSRNIVFTESDYHAYSDNFPLIENFIKSLFSTHVVLFIGYSISDYNLNLILSWIRKRTGDAPPIFTILPSEEISFEEMSYLTKKGVYPITSPRVEPEHHSSPSSNGDDDGGETTSGKGLDSLSEKSIKVARTIELIISPNPNSVLEGLREINSKLESWKLFEPYYFVRLARDELNIGDRLRYDDVRNTLIYRVNESEKKTGRLEYRLIRRELKKLLRKIPVSAFSFEFTRQLYCIIKNNHDFNLNCVYTNFDYCEVYRSNTSAQNVLQNDTDARFKNCFDSYILRKIDVSHEQYGILAFDYFKESNFVNSIISVFNRKHVWYGEIPSEMGFEAIRNAVEKEVSNTNEIYRIIDRLPRSLTERSNIVLHDLNASNAYILRRHIEVVALSRLLEKEIRKKPIYSLNTVFLLSKMRNTFLFVTTNRLALLYTTEYKSIARIGFEAVVNRQFLESPEGVCEIDAVLAYAAVMSFKTDELYEFFYESLEGEKALSVGVGVENYLFLVMKNCQNAISKNISPSVTSHAVNAWGNALAILSFLDNDEKSIKVISDLLLGTYDDGNWHFYTAIINKFLVAQGNRNKDAFSDEVLTLLLKQQIEKIRNFDDHPYDKDSGVVANILRLIDHKSRDLSTVFKDLELSSFIDLVSVMRADKKRRIINGILFTLYGLSSGKYRTKIRKLLLDAFDEAVSNGLTEDDVIYGLNLYHLKIVKRNRLTLVMRFLRKSVKRHEENRSSTSHYPIIRKLIKNIDQEYMRKYQDVVKGVDLLARGMKRWG